jgi:riboflavin biosynthesis pyrimidine reductase
MTMEPVRTVVERDPQPAKPVLPPALRELYNGDLDFPTGPGRRPHVIANFVSTLDGVISYQIQGSSGGSTISGSDTADRFIMGLLRASVDAVMVGSRTVHDVSPKHLWIPQFIYPEAQASYTDYRVNVLHKPQNPLVVIVSGSGRLDLERATFRTPDVKTLVITTPAGRDELAKAGATQLASVEIRTIDASGGSIDPQAMLQLLHSQFGVRMLLHEGGPALFGQFLASEVVDELFMTLSPQIAGRAARTIRPGLVEGVEFLPQTAPWLRLLSVKERGEHLYLRYRNTGAHRSRA